MFDKKLRELRIQKGLSQETLSELLNVSRQAISRYENGTAQPDFDKLLLLAKYFEVSTDFLLDDTLIEQAAAVSPLTKTNRISITSKVDGKVSSFYKFTLAPVMFKKENQPEVLLMGVDGHSFWGDSTVVLGWYKKKADAEKELKRILQAMSQGQVVYDLQYAAEVKKKGLFDIEVI